MFLAWSSHLEDHTSSLRHGLEMAPGAPGSWFLAEQPQGEEAGSLFSFLKRFYLFYF